MGALVDFWMVEAGVSIPLALVSLISGLVAIWMPGARRKALGGMALSGTALALWVLYAALLHHAVMKAYSM